MKTSIMQAANQTHKWVLCLDDDVLLHPTTLDDLVAAAEGDPCGFMVTGTIVSGRYPGQQEHFACLCFGCSKDEPWPVQATPLMCLRSEQAC